jgi:signal peptidase I
MDIQTAHAAESQHERIPIIRMVIVGLVGMLSSSIALLLAGVRVRWAVLPLLLPVLVAPLHSLRPAHPRVLAFGTVAVALALVALQLVLLVTAVRRARTMPRRTSREWWTFAGLALVFAIASGLGSEVLNHQRQHRLEPFHVPAGGMLPTLIVGDQFLADHRAESLARGDVVLFHPPNGSVTGVKRIIAMEGDVVEVDGNEILINGVALAHADASCGAPPAQLAGGRCVSETLPSGRSYTLLWGGRWRPRYGPRTLEAGELFVLGDNRDNSMDSRDFGPLTRERIVGRALVVWLSWSDWRLHWSRIGREL